MPKLDPYPPSPWNSPSPWSSKSQYSRDNRCHSSTCWGKAVGSFRNRKSSDMSPYLQILKKPDEVVCCDESSDNPYYRELLNYAFDHRQKSTCCGSPGRESTYTATTSTSVASSLLRMWGSSCFNSKSEFSEREPVEASLTNEEKKKKKMDVALIKDETSSNKKLQEKAAAAAKEVPAMINLKEQKPKEEPKFSWANKYQPKTLTDFICHQDKAHMLWSLVQYGESGHFIFEGDPGVGKRTMARALLREVFGPNILEIREAMKDFKLEGGCISSIQINVKMSSCHIEVNLSGLQKDHAAYVAMELIKESYAVTLNQKKSQQAIILSGAEKLTEGAQLHIRNHLETYRDHVKVYFCYSGTSKLQNLKSFCTVVQILTPSKEEIVEVLEFIAENEAVELPPKLAENIAEKAKHNVRQAIRSLEATRQLNYPFKDDQELVTGWEEELAEIAKYAIEEQTPKQWFVIKEKIENLMAHNALPAIIFETLVGELKKLLDEELQLIINDLCQEAVSFNGRYLCYGKAKSGRKIEEFVAKFMSAYRNISPQQQQIIEC